MRVHEQTTGTTGERVVEVLKGGSLRVSGREAAETLLELGDVVTFEAKHLGIRQRLTSKIVGYERPREFVDEMQKGAFRSLRHTHRFEETAGGTKMTDIVDFESPGWVFGSLANWVFLAGYMERFLARRGHELKRVAESGGGSALQNAP